MLNNQIFEASRETAPFLRFELCEFEGRPQLPPWLFDLIVFSAFEHLGFIIFEVACLNCVEKTFFLPGLYSNCQLLACKRHTREPLLL